MAAKLVSVLLEVLVTAKPEGKLYDKKFALHLLILVCILLMSSTAPHLINECGNIGFSDLRV